jgi:hypothetical protein
MSIAFTPEKLDDIYKSCLNGYTLNELEFKNQLKSQFSLLGKLCFDVDIMSAKFWIVETQDELLYTQWQKAKYHVTHNETLGPSVLVEIQHSFFQVSLTGVQHLSLKQQPIGFCNLYKFLTAKYGLVICNISKYGVITLSL